MNDQLLMPARAQSPIISFPFDRKSEQYYSGAYRQDLTDGRASLQEVNNVLKELGEARKSFDAKIFKWIMITALLLIGFSASYSIFVDQKMEKLKRDPNEKYEFYAQYALLFYVAVIVLYLSQVPKLKDERLFKLQTILFRHNQEFSRQGLRWYIPSENLYGIQLYKEYQIQADDENQEFASTNNFTIFYFNPSSQGFVSDFYSPQLTDGRAPTEEIHQTLSEFALFRRGHERRMWARYSIFPGSLLITWTIGYLLFASQFESQRKAGQDFKPSGFLFFIFLLLQFLVMFVVGVVFIKLKRSHLAKCQVEIDAKNQGFVNRGLRWEFPRVCQDESIQWIEIIKDYRIDRNRVPW